MPKNPHDPELKKHTLMLFEGDFERIAILFPKTSPSIIIRKLVHNLIQRVESANQTPDVGDNIDVNLK